MQIRGYFRTWWRLLMVLTAPLLLYSCATSSLTATRHDQNYAGNNLLRDVLAIAVTAEETSRRLYEDGFVAKLGEFGVKGIPNLIPGGELT